MATNAGERGALPPLGAFARTDEAPDGEFYDQPRFVQHIDEGTIAGVAAAIARHVPPGADVLDLMSSWVSRLPPPAGLPLGRVVGLGLSADELAATPRLTERTMHDLNADSRLPYTDASFDAALITVSIQHLTRPVDVLREVARPLRPDGVLPVLFFSNWYFTVYLGKTRSGWGIDIKAYYMGLTGCAWGDTVPDRTRPEFQTAGPHPPRP